MITGALLDFARARRTRCLPRDELKRLQSRKLKKTMSFACTQVPYYHDIVRTLGKGPEDFCTPGRLESFPVLTKTTLAERATSLRPPREKPYRVVTTTGTTGTPVEIAYSAEMGRITMVLLLRELMTAGVGRRTKFVSVWPPMATWRRVPTPDGGSKPSTALLQIPVARYLKYIVPGVSYIWSNTSDPRADASALAEKNPEFILCTPSRMARIGRTGGQSVSRVRPRRIILGSEIFTRATRDLIERTFEAETLNMYGVTEVGALGMECRSKTGIHCHEDYLVYEVLRDGERVGPGETGELTVTTLHNNAMPLIRYATGDIVKRADTEDPCECGSSVMRLSEICGRYEDCVVASDGSRIPPLRVAEVVESVLGQIDYFLVQVQLEHFELRLPSTEVVDSMQIEEVRTRLGENIGVVPTIDVSKASDEEFARKHSPIVCGLRSQGRDTVQM